MPDLTSLRRRHCRHLLHLRGQLFVFIILSLDVASLPLISVQIIGYLSVAIIDRYVVAVTLVCCTTMHAEFRLQPTADRINH